MASLFLMTFVPVSTRVLLVEKAMFIVVSARTIGHGVMKGFYELLYRYYIWYILLVLGLLAGAPAFSIRRTRFMMSHSGRP